MAKEPQSTAGGSWWVRDLLKGGGASASGRSLTRCAWQRVTFGGGDGGGWCARGRRKAPLYHVAVKSAIGGFCFSEDGEG